MTRQPARPPSVVVADTGPLLCAGGISGKDGVELLRRRFHARGIAIVEPAVVRGELNGLSRRPDAVGAAAARMRREPLIGVDHTAWPQADRDAVRAQVEARIMARDRHRGRSTTLDPAKNAGEIDAILLAQHHGAMLLCHDRPARQVASSIGITVVRFADLLRAAMAEGEIAGADVDQYLLDLPSTDFDIGVRNPTSVTIASLPEISGL